MKTRVAIVLIGLWWLSAPAFGHRLNEYLQASTIAVAKDHLVLQLHLTAGEDVARKVLAGIDLNEDGAISNVEQKTYVDKVCHDLSLTIDGSVATLQTDSFSFPPVAAINKGTGDIIITYQASIPLGNAARKLVLENHHQRNIAIYLVNCLLPNDAAISILNQNRNYNQSLYQLDFAISSQVKTSDGTTAVSEQEERLKTAENESVVKTFFIHGIRHILTGYDHLLFLIALVLATTSMWQLIKAVTAFTLAHSITLTLAVLNLAHLPQQWVELFISASIVFVALQNILQPAYAQGRSRLAIAFFFGLFHGLGFAGGLLDVMHQMPKQTVLLAILGFTIGIEAGNQLVLLPLFGVLKAARSLQKDAIRQEHLSMQLQHAGSAAVAVAGGYYFYGALTSHF